jgi:hypothetical protein
MAQKGRATMTNRTMVNKTMVNNTTSNQQSDSATHLKNVVEQCFAVLCEDKDSAAKAQTTALRCGSLPLHIDGVNLQKRALTEAARALATLWKISEPRGAKLQGRAMQYSRSTS